MHKVNENSYNVNQPYRRLEKITFKTKKLLLQAVIVTVPALAICPKNAELIKGKLRVFVEN
jgi:hypothetical protein